jgi:DNA-binding NtrC family response regulator
MARGELILPEHLPGRIRAVGLQSPDVSQNGEPASKMEEIERAIILQSLHAHQFNRSETARALGLSRRTLLYKIQRFREQGFRVEPDS